MLGRPECPRRDPRKDRAGFSDASVLTTERRREAPCRRVHLEMTAGLSRPRHDLDDERASTMPLGRILGVRRDGARSRRGARRETMLVPIVQVLALVALTHTFRALIRLAGPRRSGLL